MINQKLISIGVLGCEENNVVYQIITEILISSGFTPIYKNDKDTITILSLEDKSILIMGLTSKTIKLLLDLELYFDIIIQTYLREEDYKSPYIKNMINKAKYIIMNIDDLNSRYILDKDVKGLIITYGLNKKATITASSFKTSNNIKFNLCVQREYDSLEGNKIELMEIPIVLDLIGKNNIYHGLGAIACLLSCGIALSQIQKALVNVKGAYRYLEKLYEKDYLIVDSNCNMPFDYNSIFEEIQNIKYKNIYIISGIEIDQGIFNIKKNLEVILNWLPILDIKKILFYIDRKEELIINNIDLLFANIKIDYEIYFELKECINRGVGDLNKNDLLLLMGNDCLKDSRNLISQLI